MVFMEFVRMAHRCRTGVVSTWLAAAAGLSCSAQAQAQQAPVVTESGALQGLTTPIGTSFLGIPYAAPPLGDLRWKAPVPAAPWTGVRLATIPGQACTQDATLPPAGVPGSGEDCLYLNVHVPARAATGQPLPVMVWIHGGQYLTGAGAQYDGGELAKAANAIVVTLNYRLGIFGLLALNALTAESPAGNYALQDQQAALRWIQRNIPAFGGDPGKVTLFGQSAGSSSVCQQLVSPGAAGLFHRAIVQSGPCTIGTNGREVALATGKAFAEKIGCPDGPMQLACLRAKPAAELLAAAPTLDFDDLRSLQVMTPWVDGVVLPALPKDLIKQGKYNRVPVMLGSNREEGRIFIGLAYDIRLGAPMTEAQYQTMVQRLAGGTLQASLVTAAYPSKRLGSPGLAASALVTDAVYACGTQWTGRALASRTPTYLYEFQEPGPVLAGDTQRAWGAYHEAELPYLFRSAMTTNPPLPALADSASAAQLALARQMAEYWGRFAATGDPNGAPGAAHWPAASSFWPAIQLLKAPKVSTDLRGAIYANHQCLIWDLAQALGLGI